jgi:hypothetical protein
VLVAGLLVARLHNPHIFLLPFSHHSGQMLSLSLSPVMCTHDSRSTGTPMPATSSSSMSEWQRMIKPQKTPRIRNDIHVFPVQVRWQEPLDVHF